MMVQSHPHIIVCYVIGARLAYNLAHYSTKPKFVRNRRFASYVLLCYIAYLAFLHISFDTVYLNLTVTIELLQIEYLPTLTSDEQK